MARLLIAALIPQKLLGWTLRQSTMSWSILRLSVQVPYVLQSGLILTIPRWLWAVVLNLWMSPPKWGGPLVAIII